VKTDNRVPKLAIVGYDYYPYLQVSTFGSVEDGTANMRNYDCALRLALRIGKRRGTQCVAKGSYDNGPAQFSCSMKQPFERYK